MRSILILALILLSLLAYISFGQTYSSIDYPLGTSLEVGTGADVCANDIIFTGGGTWSGGGTICSGPLPVTLVSFQANIKSRDVKLIWVTENEINNAGFDIERKALDKNGNGSWQKIAFVQGMGNTTGQTIYTYEDKKLQTGKYDYRLKQNDYNGTYEYYDLEGDISIEKPNVFTMSQNYPNPSNPKSKIDYEIPVNGRITIKLYNTLGQEVKSIIDETKEAGYYTAEFDGTDLASGVYFYRIIAEGEGQKFTKTLKMILVK
jgi:hypothetical protein